jgi:hypothetical protein
MPRREALFERTRLSQRGICFLSTMESGFQCASCGEWNTTSVDESAGRRQSYVEDCQICCKPNVLRIEYDNSSQEFFITAELE